MNPIAKAIEEIEAAIPSVDQCGRDVAANEYMCGMIHALDILRRNLTGTAMVDVNSHEEQEFSCHTCSMRSDNDDVCMSYVSNDVEDVHIISYFLSHTRPDWCPAYVVKGELAMKFIKKPVEVEAMQWTGDNQDAIEMWSKNKVRYIGGDLLEIVTLEGNMIASPGDWIIRGVNGEFYTCKPDIFQKSYEKKL
jgi:hypothetical protein